MLDLLEAGMATDRTTPMGKTESISPDHLRLEMESAGLSRADFTEIFGTQPATLQNWLMGKTSIPHWVMPALRIFEQLPPAARRKFVNVIPRPQPAQAPQTRTEKHPFSRIEDL